MIGWSPGAPGIMPAVRRAIVLAIAVLVLVPVAAHAAPVTLAKIGDFAAPVYVTAPLGDTARVFVVEKGGTIQVLDGAVRATFLDITSKVNSTDNERGLLSMAFALDYSTSGLFYVYYTAKSPVGQVTIEEHRVDPANPDHADPAYARTLVTIPHDQQANHNGGQLQFGPDGLLYAGTGDGGSGGDPSGNAQNVTPAAPTVVSGVNHDYRLGKLLQIDPASGAVSIFAYGLRNPWRFSYDRNTGDLVIGDVGQDRYEEIDVVRAGSGGGQNFGWNRMEGFHCYPSGDSCSIPGLTPPVTEYGHALGCSVTGGVVYRGTAFPALAGAYLFSDYCSGTIWAIDAAANETRNPAVVGQSHRSISSFGEDETGEVYFTDLAGELLRIVATPR
jgi:glucose/arabinose dehydrogenase